MLKAIQSHESFARATLFTSPPLFHFPSHFGTATRMMSYKDSVYLRIFRIFGPPLILKRLTIICGCDPLGLS